MKSRRLLASALLVALAGPVSLAGPVVLAAPGTLAAETLVLIGGRYLDVEAGALRPNAGILVRGGKILSVGAAPGGGEGLRVLRLDKDEVCLPGFIDLHAHYAVDLFGKGRVDERDAYPALFLANGVTTTFPAGEMDPYAMRELRIAVDRGERVGPRILNSGPYFGRWRKGWDDDVGALELAREVDQWAELGVRGFKAKGIAPRHLEVLIERAHHHGLTVTGHLDSGFRDTVNPRDAILMGIDRVEHFLGGAALDPEAPVYDSLVDVEPGTPEFAAIAQLYISHGAYFDATLSAYGYFGERDSAVYEDFADEHQYLTPHMRRLVTARGPRRAIDRFEKIFHVKAATLLAFHDAGGGHLITVGTDHPSWGDFFAPFGIHRELHAMVRAGLSPAAALRCGTLNGARAMGLGDQLGSIEAGKLADLVVVRGDPLTDILATRRVRWVVRGGALHDVAELLRGARGRIGPADEDAEGDWQPGR